MKTALPFRFVLTIACTLSLDAASRAATFETVGTYDADPGNFVDTDTGTTFGAFKSNVSSAFSVDRGGVIDFATGYTGGFSLAGGTRENIGTSWDASYGTSQSKTLQFTTSVDMLLFNNNTSGQVDTISDTNNLLPIDDQVQFGLTVGPILNGDPGEIVSEVAFTVLSRDPGGSNPGGADVVVTALFSDGSMETITDNVDDPVGSDDTFFHFVAPSQESVVSLSFDNLSLEGTPNQRRLPIDDLAFLTRVVPEPSSGLIATLLMLGLVMRKRSGQNAGARS